MTEEYKEDCIEYVIKEHSPFCCIFGVYISCEDCKDYAKVNDYD